MKKNAIKKTMGGFLKKTMVSTIAISQIVTPLAYATEAQQNNDMSDEINIRVNQSDDVDVVLTLGSTQVDTSSFKNDLIRELRKKNINSNVITVTAVETQELNLQSSFAWNQHVSPSVGSIAIQNNGSKIQMYGNPKNAGFNKIFSENNTDPDLKEQIIDFTFTLDFGDSFDGAGVLLNTHVTGNNMNGYALFFPKSGSAQLYQLTNWSNSTNQDIKSSPNSKLIATVALGNSGSFSLKMTKDSLGITKNGQLVNTIALPTHYGWGLGFFSDHYSHGCSRIGQFSLNDIKLGRKKAKEFNSLIREPNWGEESARFIVNLEDGLISDFENPLTSGEILTRLLNEEIHYLQVGTNTNKLQAETLIAKNNNNGVFLTNDNYNNIIENVSNYIANVIDKPTSADGSQYVLVDKEIEFSIDPENLKENTATPEFPDGRWRVDHNHKYYDNDLGQVPFSKFYQDVLPTTLSKPGEYLVFFGHRNPTPQYIYAHRRPVANFSMKVNRMENDVQVETLDYSYDLDREFSEDKGISEKQWRWKEVADTEWTDGLLPSSLPFGKNYIVELKVKDHQDTWSKPSTIFITTGEIATNPIANFSIGSNIQNVKDALNLQDTSYDPSGKKIVEKEWTVSKNNSQVYKGATPLNSLLAYGAGEYTISLKVKNDANLWSESYSRSVTVSLDEIVPEAIAGPNIKPWTAEDINVTINFSDDGGSDLDGQRFVVTNSNVAPSNGWSEWSNLESLQVELTENGQHYIHVEAKDGNGNILRKTFGAYEIDKSPVVEPVLTQTENGFKLDITTPISGVKEILYKVDDSDWIRGLDKSQMMIGDYKISVQVVNNAGIKSNIVTSDISIGRAFIPISEKIEEAKRLVSNISSQEDIDIAQGLIEDAKASLTPLDEGLIKNTLEAEIEILEVNIDINQKIFKAETTVHDLLVNHIDLTSQELIDNASAKLLEAEESVALLPEGKLKTNLSKKVEDIKQRIASAQELNDTKREKQAEAFVKIAEILKREPHIGNAKEKVAKLKNGDIKEGLEERIRNLEAHVKDRDDNLAYEELKQTAKDAIKEAKNLEDIDSAQIFIDVLNPEDKQILQPDLNSKKDAIQNANNISLDAPNAVTLAEQTKTIEDLEIAKGLVSKLPNGEEKKALEDRIVKVEKQIKELNTFNKAVSSVEEAEASLTMDKVKSAYAKVNSLPETEDKTELINRLKKVEEDIANKNTSTEKDKETIKAVDLAESLKREPYIQQAKDKIASLEEGSLKDSLEDRLQNVELALNADSDAVIRSAKRYVELAEALNRDPHITKAKNVVNALNPSTVKTELLLRIEAISGPISAERKAIIEVTSYVENAEKYKYASSIRKAYEKINLLQDSQEKTALTERLNKITL